MSSRLSRLATALTVLVWLRLAGEAAFGDQRPAFERQWKGVSALLLAVAGAIHLWNLTSRRRPSMEDRGGELLSARDSGWPTRHRMEILG